MPVIRHGQGVTVNDLLQARQLQQQQQQQQQQPHAAPPPPLPPIGRELRDTPWKSCAHLHHPVVHPPPLPPRVPPPPPPFPRPPPFLPPSPAVTNTTPLAPPWPPAPPATPPPMVGWSVPWRVVETGDEAVFERWAHRTAEPQSRDGGRELLLRGNQRAYLIGSRGEPPHRRDATWETLRYDKLSLLGKTLRMTIDVSNVGCGCNAALYLVAMPDTPDHDGPSYCDAPW